jgi:hypothetical protein
VLVEAKALVAAKVKAHFEAIIEVGTHFAVAIIPLLHYYLLVSAQTEGPIQWDEELGGLVEELVELVEQEGPQGPHGGFLQLSHSEYSTPLSSYHHLQDHSLR